MRALAALFVLVSCTGSGSPDTESRVEWARGDLVGCYGDLDTIVNGGRATVGDLLLCQDGSYRSSVFNGSSDGCLTVFGAGLSEGRWQLEGTSITFSPTRETPDLILRFAEIVAEPDPAGLTLVVGEHRTALKRKSEPTFIDPE